MLKELVQKAAEGFLGSAGQIIDDLTLSKEEKARIKVELAAIASQKFAELQETVRARYEAVAQIIVAEQQHGDSYTRRARPTVVYSGLAMFAGKAIASGFGIEVEIPAEFTYSWAGICSAWVLARSGERVAKSVGAKNGATEAARVITGAPALPDL